MPPPLSDGAVTYADGTKATVPQMAHDVVPSSPGPEPNLEARHRTGVQVSCFLLLAGIFYAAKRKIWAAVHWEDHDGPVIGVIGGSGLYEIDGLATSFGGVSRARLDGLQTSSALAPLMAKRSFLSPATGAGMCCRRRRSTFARISMR